MSMPANVSATAPNTPAMADKPYAWKWQVMTAIGALVVTTLVGIGALLHYGLQSWSLLAKPGSSLDVSVTANAFEFPVGAEVTGAADCVKELADMKKSLIVTITNNGSLPAKNVSVIFPAKRLIYLYEGNDVSPMKLGERNMVKIPGALEVEQTYRIYAWCDTPLINGGRERVAVSQDGAPKEVAFSSGPSQSPFWIMCANIIISLFVIVISIYTTINFFNLTAKYKEVSKMHEQLETFQQGITADIRKQNSA